jgi:hypothetical protein
MRCFVKKEKNVLKKKLVRGSAIPKNLSSGARDLQKVKNRWSKPILLLKLLWSLGYLYYSIRIYQYDRT